VWRLCWGGHRRLHRTWLGVVEIAPGGGEGLGGASVRGGFVAGVGAASGVEGRQAGAGGILRRAPQAPRGSPPGSPGGSWGRGACVVVFNVVAGLGICCGCFPGFLHVRGVL